MQLHRLQLVTSDTRTPFTSRIQPLGPPTCNQTTLNQPHVSHNHSQQEVIDQAIIAVSPGSDSVPHSYARKRWLCRVCSAPLSTSSNRNRHERAKHPQSDAAARLDGRFVHPHFDSRIPEPGEDIEDLPPVNREHAYTSGTDRCSEFVTAALSESDREG